MRLSFLHFIPLYLVARVNLYFTSPLLGDGYVLNRQLKMFVSGHSDVKQQIDYSIFVSIDSNEFKRILEHNVFLVHVTLTNSQVKFSGPIAEIILTTEVNQNIK
ncbi:unnamed protein product [Citrullus colocynthis]|uniref:Uncharacterized protein n=1 Tax=Citrullus colocynthis TaxID=252529 RepID=A0ABP0Z7V7_9ROSI